MSPSDSFGGRSGSAPAGRIEDPGWNLGLHENLSLKISTIAIRDLDN